MALMQPIPSPQVAEAYARDVLDIAGFATEGVAFYFARIDTLGLEELAHGGGLNAIQETGGRFFARYTPDGPVACDMTAPGPARDPRLRNVVRGEQAELLLQALEIAQGLPEVQEHDYELRILAIPGLRFEALRLKTLVAGQSEMVVPILAMDLNLQEMVSHQLDPCLAALSAFAVERLKFDDSILEGPQPAAGP